MAHFANIIGDLVNRVIVISNDDIVDEHGRESEQLGIKICLQVAGPGEWIQTSYHGNFRRHYAGLYPGMTYDRDLDVFLFPKPYPSWVLDFTCELDWVPPIPRPTKPCENGAWTWNEGEGNWECVQVSEQP